MNFDFYSPIRLITGRGCVARQGAEMAALGDRCLIVTSGSAAKKSGALDDVTGALDRAGVAYTVYDKVRQNPVLTDSKEAGDMARAFGARCVVGIGGGSPLDAAKAAAVFATNDCLLEAYQPDKWQSPPLPLVMVGTTAGTGSEVAPYAVLTTPEGRKQSISSPLIYARITYGDPGYTDSLPLAFTVSTALDALSHALEGYFSTTCNDMSDLFALDAVKLLMPELRALRSIRDAAAISTVMRDRLYYGSVLAGYTLAKCGTSFCHALGYFLSEDHGVPHGFACAVTLPEFVRRAGRLMQEKAARLQREVGTTEQEICALIEALTEMPRIRLSAAEIDELADRGARTKNFTHTGPNGYTREEAHALLTRLYGA